MRIQLPFSTGLGRISTNPYRSMQCRLFVLGHISYILVYKNLNEKVYQYIYIHVYMCGYSISLKGRFFPILATEHADQRLAVEASLTMPARSVKVLALPLRLANSALLRFHSVRVPT